MLDICLIIITSFIGIIIFALIFLNKKLHILLYLNSLTSLIIILICLLSTVTSNQFYVDIAIIYAILSFIAVSGYLRYFIETKDTNVNEQP